MLLEAVVATTHDGETCCHFDAADEAVDESAVAIGDGELGVKAIVGQEIEGVNEAEDAAVERTCYDVAAAVTCCVFYGVYLVAHWVRVHIKLIMGL